MFWSLGYYYPPIIYWIILNGSRMTWLVWGQCSMPWIVSGGCLIWKSGEIDGYQSIYNIEPASWFLKSHMPATFTRNLKSCNTSRPKKKKTPSKSRNQRWRRPVSMMTSCWNQQLRYVCQKIYFLCVISSSKISLLRNYVDLGFYPHFNSKWSVEGEGNR